MFYHTLCCTVLCHSLRCGPWLLYATPMRTNQISSGLCTCDLCGWQSPGQKAIQLLIGCVYLKGIWGHSVSSFFTHFWIVRQDRGSGSWTILSLFTEIIGRVCCIICVSQPSVITLNNLTVCLFNVPDSKWEWVWGTETRQAELWSATLLLFHSFLLILSSNLSSGYAWICCNACDVL